MGDGLALALALQPACLLRPIKNTSINSLSLRPFTFSYSCPPLHIHVVHLPHLLLSLSNISVQTRQSIYSFLYENTKSVNMPKAKKIAYKKCHQCRKDRQKVSTMPVRSSILNASPPSIVSMFCILVLLSALFQWSFAHLFYYSMPSFSKVAPYVFCTFSRIVRLEICFMFITSAALLHPSP